MTSLGRCLVVFALLLAGGSAGPSWHSLRYLYIVMWDLDQGKLDFVAMAYFDDQLGGLYNSTMRRAVPMVSWIEKIEKDDPDFWEWNTARVVNYQQRMKMHLTSLQNNFNLSRGLHTWQCIFGCELSGDGSQERHFLQFGYNGENYLNFDKETQTWTAAVEFAEVTKKQWEPDLKLLQRNRVFLKEGCIKFVHKFLDYGKESLLRRESPVVRVGRKADNYGLETLICRAHGFYPKEIDATWRKDGEVWEQETFRGGIVPNSDGTYHTWLSIKIPSKDREQYRCHVEHDSLPEPLDVACVEPSEKPKGFSTVGLIVGILLVVVALCMPGSIFYLWRRQRDSQAAHTTPQ